MKNNLKLCPFCKNKNIIIEEERVSKYSFRFYAMCSKCFARGPSITLGTDKIDCKAMDSLCAQLWNIRNDKALHALSEIELVQLLRKGK